MATRAGGTSDIHGIDFRNMDYPAGQCHEDTGISETMTVRNGEFSEETQGGKASFKIIGDVQYADLTGDGREEAVVTARCALEGAESETTQLYVLGIADTKPVLLGRIDPEGMLRDYQRYYPDGKVLWQVDRVEAKGGSLLLAISADGAPDRPDWRVSMAYRWDGKTFTVPAKPERQAPAQGGPSQLALGRTPAQGAAPSTPAESKPAESKQGEASPSQIPAQQQELGSAPAAVPPAGSPPAGQQAAAEPVKPGVASPPLASQPGRITVTAGMCLCGEQSGGFDATYQGRTIDVGFTRGAAAPASAPGQPLNQPLKVLAGQRELKDAEWRGLICKQGAEPQPCAITGKTLEVEGQWDGDEAFTAQVLHLSQELWASLAPSPVPSTVGQPASAAASPQSAQPITVPAPVMPPVAQEGPPAVAPAPAQAPAPPAPIEAQGGQKPIGEKAAGPSSGEQATYVPTPSAPTVSPPAAEAPPPTTSPAPPSAAAAPIATSNPSLPPEQLGPQLVREMLAYARDNAGVGHEEEIRGTKKRLDWLPSPPVVDQAKARKANERGQAQLRAGRIKEAVKTLEQALAADPGDVEILNNLGYAYFRQGDLDQAERYLISALTISPARAPVWANLGQIYAKKGDIPNAIASFVNSFRFSKNRAKTQQFFQQLTDKERDLKVKQALQQSIQLAREHLMSAGRD